MKGKSPFGFALPFFIFQCTRLRWQDIDFEDAIISVRAANSKTGGQRHSYATYYLKARCGEIHRLQLNMGHRSAQLLYSRYVNMAGTTRDMAEKWWQILPD